MLADKLLQFCLLWSPGFNTCEPGISWLDGDNAQADLVHQLVTISCDADHKF